LVHLQLQANPFFLNCVQQQAQSSSELPEVSLDAEALENSTTLPPMSETQTESHWDLVIIFFMSIAFK
jgi:hypothetical protein